MRAAGPDAFFDAIEMRSNDGIDRLRAYARRANWIRVPGFWNERDLVVD